MMKENKIIIFKAVAIVILIVTALIIWVNMILREPERTFKHEPLTASQEDDRLQGGDIYIDNMVKGGKYTAKGRLIINNLNK